MESRPILICPNPLALALSRCKSLGRAPVLVIPRVNVTLTFFDSLQLTRTGFNLRQLLESTGNPVEPFQFVLTFPQGRAHTQPRPCTRSLYLDFCYLVGRSTSARINCFVIPLLTLTRINFLPIHSDSDKSVLLPRWIRV